MSVEDHIPEAHKQVTAEPQDAQELPDVCIVNPGGRVVEVTGEQAQELLQEMGFRKATAAETKTYHDQIQAVVPEVLRLKEQARVKAEKKAAADYMAKEAEAPAPAAPATEPAAAPKAEDKPAADAPKARASK